MEDQTKEKFNSWPANNPRPALVITILLFAGCLFLEFLPWKYLSSALALIALGFVSLYLMPYVLGLPSGRKSLREYCYDIRLLPMSPVVRNIGIGLLMAALTLSSILIASLLTGHFVLDWGEVPLIRLIKGLTRGIWEEVFFRGIILVILMRIYPFRRAVLTTTFIFAMTHLGGFSLEVIIDVISIFFMGLLFVYIVLKTGSLLPAIVFHYVHDIFIYLVQYTPGADQTMKLVLLYAFLWTALIIGGFLTKYIVERRPSAS
jgi:membrane protease YdiL (CAAX protease family)